MNLLAHCYLAQKTGTSYAGQLLGDIVKGRLDESYPPAVREGIRLHRLIDSLSDDHPGHRRLRRQFAPPQRRYAPILVDIGFDYSLARAWSDYSDQPLSMFAQRAEDQVRAQWPDAAPFDSVRMRGLARILTGYARPEGLQHALDSVARRLRRANPVAYALPAILRERDEFDRALPILLSDLEAMIIDRARARADAPDE